MRKVAITGPESTGKTTLAGQLAEYYKTAYVPEFAREYMGMLNRPYTYADVLYIAEQQLALESQYINAGYEWLFVDTDLWVIRIWLMDKFGEVPQWIEAELRQVRYHLHLLMAPDLPWQTDPLREDPERLDSLFETYYQQLKAANHPFAVVRGQGEMRLNNALYHLAALG